MTGEALAESATVGDCGGAHCGQDEGPTPARSFV